MTDSAYDLFVLLRLRLNLLLRWSLSRYTRSAKAAAPIRLIVMLLLLLWFLSLLIRSATTILNSILSESQARTIVAPFLAWGTSVTALIIFLYAIVTLAGTLTYRSDLKLLLLTPISPRVILAEKILAVSLGFSPLLLLTLPAVLGIGHALHLGPIYDLTVLAMVILVPIGPVSLAMLLLLAVLHLVPPARVQTATVVLGTILSGTIFIGMQWLTSPMSSLRTGFSPPLLPDALPTTWAGHALAAIVLGRPATGLVYFLATLSLATLLYGLAIGLSARMLATGSATYGEVRRRASTSHANHPSSTARLPTAPQTTHQRRESAGIRGRVADLRWWPLLGREWRSLRRDPQRLAALAYPLVIVAFYAYRILTVQRSTRLGAEEHPTPLLIGSLTFMLTLTAILLIGSIAPSLINHEGRSLYLIALAPVSPRDILLAKWAMCGTPTLALVEVMLVVGAVLLHLSLDQWVMTALAIAALVIALSALTLSINLVWPRLNTDGGKQQASFPAVVVGMAGQLLLGGAVFVLLLLALGSWTALPLATLGAVLGILVLTAAVTLGSIWLGSRRLQGLLTSDRASR